MNRLIKTYPASVLRHMAKPVDAVDKPLVTLAHDMAETMYLARGIGLAAPQVGESCCLIVADIGEGLLQLFNPRIVAAEGEAAEKEGCLSVPEITLEIRRAARVVVEGLNHEGKPVTVEAEDLLARVLQHEIDHLHGTLIIDRISKAHRQLISGKLKRLRREYQHPEE